MTTRFPTRAMDEILHRHRLFWQCAETDRPLIGVAYDYMLQPQVTASAQPLGEVTPDRLDIGPTLEQNEKVARVRELIGDDAIPAAGPLLGVPWLEAMCGCRVLNQDGTSLWPEPPGKPDQINRLLLAPDNRWFVKLLEAVRSVVSHAAGRYPVSISHLRGPADVLVALFGSEHFFLACYDEPERIAGLAQQVAAMWAQVARAQLELNPGYLGGFSVFEFDLWAPEPVAYVQDDTSGMISLAQYRQLFVPALRNVAFLPYNALHLHIPSLHLAEELARIPNIRAVNCSCDSKTVSFRDALPTLRRLQEHNMPIIINKYVEEGFTLAEYEEILDGLSPRGLCVQLKADTIEEGQAVMETVRARAAKGQRHP